MAADADTFDFIVTGAGSAGCVVAGRLAESRQYRVLLLEAGPPDNNPWIHIPLGYAKTYVDPAVNWKFETEPQPQMNNRRLYLPRGKTLGGSSSINGMVYIRGHHADYDEWRQRGCTGWDWDSVLPYFKKAENQARGADPFHATGGPLHVSDQSEKGELSQSRAASLRPGRHPGKPRLQRRAAGRLRLLPDHHPQQTPLERRESLPQQPATQPDDPDQRPRHPRADRKRPRHRRRIPNPGRPAAPVTHGCEVIVSGGAYGSPHLLLLSGLGPAQHLRDMGIDVDPRHAGGRRPTCTIISTPSQAGGAASRSPSTTCKTTRCGRSPPAFVTACSAPARWPATASPPALFTRSDPRLERPDIQVNLFEWSTKERSRDAVIPHPFPGFSLSPVHLRPDGRGTVRLGSPDPFAWPAVLFDYLRTDYDIQAALAGLRLVRKIAEQPALRPYIVNEIFPGVDITSDDDLLDFVRRTGVSNQHPTSSCAMGTGPNTVVDPRLRVHGIAGLRVADASIMPVVVGGNTNAPTIMIGEKAAAMILEDARAGAPSLAA